jgi:hypothetical protein
MYFWVGVNWMCGVRKMEVSKITPGFWLRWWYNSLSFFFFFLETKSCYVAQAGLEFMILCHRLLSARIRHLA